MPALGGDVIVRGARLSGRLSCFQPAPERAELRSIDKLTVVGPDDKPLLSEAEWERFGGVHFAAAIALFNAAERLSGLNPEDAAKN